MKLKLLGFFVFSFLLSKNAYCIGEITKTNSDYDALTLVTKIRNFTPVGEMDPTSLNFKYKNSDYSFDEYVSKIIPFMKNAVIHRWDSDFYHGRLGLESTQLDADTYSFFAHTIEDPSKLDFLREVFPEGYISEEEWRNAKALLQNILDNKPQPSEATQIPPYFKSQEFFRDVEKAVSKIQNLVEEGDTVVGVGNTPQYILRALEYGQKKLNLVPVALSGWPGVEKKGWSRFLQNIATEKGLEKYRGYLKNIGLTDPRSHKRIFFLDIIGGGGGVEFLIEEFTKSYKETGINIPPLFIIALNDVGDKFEGKHFNIDAFSLKLTDLAQKLDRMPKETRITPDFPAWRWHVVNVIPSTLQMNQDLGHTKKTLQSVVRGPGSGSEAQEVIDLLSTYFGHTRIGCLYVGLEQLDDTQPQIMDVPGWKSRLEFFEKKPYENRKFFNTYFDLVDLYGENNNQAFCKLVEKIKDPRWKEQHVRNWEYFKEHQNIPNIDQDVLGMLMNFFWNPDTFLVEKPIDL